MSTVFPTDANADPNTPSAEVRRPRPRRDPLTLPAYCHHRTKNRAYVRLSGEFIYLGAYDSPESHAAYQRVVAEWLARGRVPRAAGEGGPSVNEVLLAYWRWGEGYYVDPDGRPSREMDFIAYCIKPLKELYGMTAAAAFGPLALKAVRQKMLDADLCRGVINQRIGCIKRIFKWAVAEELVPPGVHHALAAVDGLRRGHTTARETAKVLPVPDAHVDAVLPFLPPTLKSMVELQRLTGMRSGELVILRTCDVEHAGPVWQYRPQRHKTSNRGHERVVRMGPRAQAILAPLLNGGNPEAFLFSPAAAQAERRAAKRAARRTRVQPSQADRRKRRPRRSAGERYGTRSYYRAVLYGIEAAVKAGTLAKGTRWHPHQLRHSYGTLIRKERGLDAARALMGHRTLSQADEYAELDGKLACQVASEFG
jgi:integrase